MVESRVGKHGRAQRRPMKPFRQRLEFKIVLKRSVSSFYILKQSERFLEMAEAINYFRPLQTV